MDVTDSDLAEPKVQVEVLKERQRHLEERIRHEEQELAKGYVDLGRRERELEQVRGDRDDLRIKCEVVKKDLQHKQESLAQSGRKTAGDRNVARFQAFFVSLIFLLSSVRVNLGTSALTSIPANLSLGWVILSLAAAAYIIAALMTTLHALERGN